MAHKKNGTINEDFLKRIDMVNTADHSIEDVYAPVKKHTFSQDEIYSNDLYNEDDYVEVVKDKGNFGALKGILIGIAITTLVVIPLFFIIKVYITEIL